MISVRAQSKTNTAFLCGRVNFFKYKCNQINSAAYILTTQPWTVYAHVLMEYSPNKLAHELASGWHTNSITQAHTHTHTHTHTHQHLLENRTFPFWIPVFRKPWIIQCNKATFTITEKPLDWQFVLFQTVLLRKALPAEENDLKLRPKKSTQKAPAHTRTLLLLLLIDRHYSAKTMRYQK